MDIIVKELSKKYDNIGVLNKFSAIFKENKVTVVMGKSGTGKTTLLNCVANLVDYEGEIIGADGVSYVFQEDRLIPHLTVYDNLYIALSEKNKTVKEFRIKEILAAVELTDKAAKLPGELSGGEKKRVSLARAFIAKGGTILLDEPLNSLDLGLKRKIDEYFLSIIEREKKTAIYVTHDVDEALFVADTIMVLNNGEVAWSYDFFSDKSNRKITDEESVKVREKLINFLYV
ncbi:MAG: ATP-binding cassette domain-containing protein [Clostridia bacterium]|nr:ATP-binding cassette domain-containing protein [Clostridia bacterium]